MLIAQIVLVIVGAVRHRSIEPLLLFFGVFIIGAIAHLPVNFAIFLDISLTIALLIIALVGPLTSNEGVS